MQWWRMKPYTPNDDDNEMKPTVLTVKQAVFRGSLNVDAVQNIIARFEDMAEYLELMKVEASNDQAIGPTHHF